MNNKDNKEFKETNEDWKTNISFERNDLPKILYRNYIIIRKNMNK